ncbi:activity-dependent neuroprotector homeobox protein 2 isoform X2 [Bombina bombina]|uniref:activity-dependent neuroprotector homeobox protein 2 isoform X2 n=1 Tax=Bombina bombina TaxID=8345 RepID=UPI00235A824A|nr:activity-dependent neuroprotector homeobox protein 2 isoform X2 [Bombina bombina]
MFQPPVNNLEKIRKARKKVKQILLEIGLETCRNVLEDYRTKPFCCSLCKFSTKLLSSFKNHLQRYHEDEKDLELLAACPSCPFTSRSKTVLKHMRIFHTSVRNTQKPPVKENPVVLKNITFSCLKCNFTDTLYYSMKKHVLITHCVELIDSYFGEKPEEEIIYSPVFKSQPLNKYFCKKCSYIANSHDTLMYHILTSEKHRDLEHKLRMDISEFNKTQGKRTRPRKMLLPVPSQSPKEPSRTPPVTPTVTATVHPPPDYKEHSYNSKNGALLNPFVGTPTNFVQKVLPKVSAVSNSPTSLNKKNPPILVPANQVRFLTASLSQNQNIALQQNLQQPVFVSSKFPVNQSVNSAMLPQNCNVNGQFISIPQGTLNQPLHLQPNIINMNQTVQPIFPMNQPLSPDNLNANQNTILSTPIIRQLIPTGKQVNGIPTYTLITLPVAPCPVPVANSPKMPVQTSKPENTVQVLNTKAILPSSTVVPLADKSLQIANTPASPQNALSKEAKQWKTCPVCNELFPSNVYQVHMEVAHTKADSNRNESANPTTGGEMKERVILAAQASFLKVMKEKSIRCLSCRCLATEEELLKHLLMHGMVCLYCKAVFHELRHFVYHMSVMHLDKKKLHVDFIKKGIDIAHDANDNVRFPHFDYYLKVAKEELGDKDINLAIVAGSKPYTFAPIYIKIQQKSLDSIVLGGKQTSKCPFCNCALSKTEVYETHLKERHHIMPTVHTILKTPAFKCIHCCGVYTGSMTLSAIAVHLQRCRNAPKDSSLGVEVLPEANGVKGQLSNVTMHDNSKSKLTCSASESQSPNDEVAKAQHTNLQNTSIHNNESIPCKRRKVEIKSDTSEVPIEEDSLHILALIPKNLDASYESKKAFLTEYFHKKPYPSKKEIELLSKLLDMWKSDVASHFGMKRYLCLRFIKSHKFRVMLGFQMSALKELKHNLDLQEDY